MAPLQFEALLFREVRHTLVAGLGVLIAKEERATVFISFFVVAGSREAPRAFGVDLTQEFQIPLVAHGKIIAAVAQIEATAVLVTIRRHDEATGIALGEGEEAIRDGEGQRHIGDNQIGRTEDYVLAGTYLGARQSNIEVGMGFVASGVAAVSQVDLAIVVALRLLTGQEAILLLGINVFDEAFLGFEVKRHRVGVVGVLPHGEDWLTLDAVLGRGVFRAGGMNQTAVKTQLDLVALQVHILVLHLSRTVEMGSIGGGHIHQRVVGLIVDGCVDAVFLLTVDGVEAQRVVYRLVVVIDSELQRVHARGVGSMKGLLLNGYSE